jgi:hypothetical protein
MHYSIFLAKVVPPVQFFPFPLLDKVLHEKNLEIPQFIFTLLWIGKRNGWLICSLFFSYAVTLKICYTPLFWSTWQFSVEFDQSSTVSTRRSLLSRLFPFYLLSVFYIEYVKNIKVPNNIRKKKKTLGFHYYIT